MFCSDPRTSLGQGLLGVSAELIGVWVKELYIVEEVKLPLGVIKIYSYID